MIYQDNREESKENNTNRRSKLMMEFYKSDPITIVDGVPVFVEDDFYSANYDEIADTLLSNIARGGVIPGWRRRYGGRLKRILSKYANDI